MAQCKKVKSAMTATIRGVTDVRVFALKNMIAGKMLSALCMKK